jgi:lipoprotein-anchoring transpeptidase ErfK/SrfK
MQRTSISRRTFLTFSAASALAAASSFKTLGYAFAAEPRPAPSAAPAPLGRVTIWGVEIYEEPTRRSKLLRTAKRDDLINLYEQVWAEPVMPHNEIWFKTDGGYCYSSFVQPVFNLLNKVEKTELEAASKKFWGEVSVPFTDAYMQPDKQSKVSMRLYYHSAYRVVGAVQAKDGAWWYRLHEGIAYGPGPYVPAPHIRRFAPEALSPLGEKAKTKRIEVDLTLQRLTCFEEGEPMLTARIASGEGLLFTPKGNHSIIYKTPAARMSGGEGADFYDLPGVPFPSYFTLRGAAIHGAYWHNDYGRKRSHGCVNIVPTAALWVWRWVQPAALYETDKTYAIPGQSTQVLVF